QYFGIELFGGDFKGLLIPRGFVHGFITLEMDSTLLYHHTAFYDPLREVCVRYDDPAIGIQWPVAVKHISEKDLSYPFINENFKGLP
nr:dTDP-4-dehydrorhamnose 3,5-epimerase family protein [Saprospiraceae bacterium]